MPTYRLTLVQAAIIVTTCLALTGCQLWPFKQQGEDTPPQPPSAEVRESDPGPAADSINQAMTLLQDGQEARAEDMLSRLLAQRPDHPTARLLLAQIRQPPEELLGESFEEIEVHPGDSLSAIAGRSINNELLFYALARLNDIDVPRLLRPGQKLLVPRLEPVEAVEEEAQDTESPAAEAQSVLAQDEDTLQETARRLIRSERHSQAYALLLSAARADKLSQPGNALLAEASVALARAACDEDDPERALRVLNQASPWLGASADGGEFARQRNHVDARLSLGDAERALASGEHDAAFNALMIAREKTADLRETHRQRLEQVESVLGEHYHDGALSAWRDQQVDLSIELWSRVVRINPEFEPAIRYLERARRARRELQSMEED